MKNKTADKVFEKGNKKDGKHYWLTPPELQKRIQELTGIKFSKFFDPCPYPKPDNFDGLNVDWGKFSYVNPPFGVIDSNGKKIGATAWFRKAKAESLKGKLVLFVFPIHNWLVEAMVFCGANVVHLGNVKWLAIEDNQPGKGCGAIAMFILDGRKK
jgi:hypothetical protein